MKIMDTDGGEFLHPLDRLLEEKRHGQSISTVRHSVRGLLDQRYYEQVSLADCCSTAVCTGAHTHFLSER